mgnify:CR=1 FL=1|tara:strand:- start:267 stop:956 length:690 start_codon:yes stop_codon:yes gene_type:complete
MSTLSELRTRARRKVDAVDNDFFSDAEINDYINIGLGELHDLLVSKQEDYYVRKLSFSLVSAQSDYNFSDIGLTNFYKLLAVDSVQSGNTFRVKRFGFPDRNKFQADLRLHNSRGYSNYEYAIQEEMIKFIPEPGSSGTIDIYYVPAFKKLLGDDSKVSDIVALNWEEYAVTVAAIKMRQKEETPVANLERDLEKTQARIEEASRNRDSAEPFGITDETTGILHGFWSS